MKIVFGVLSLLVVLALVGLLAKKQLQATHVVPAGLAGVPAAAPDATVKQQATTIERQFRDATERALQQGVDRDARAPQ